MSSDVNTASRVCECLLAGFCQRYQRVQSPRMVAMCQGTADGLTAEECAVYRANWERLVKFGAKDAALEQRATCSHLGEERRREPCETCCGKVLLKIFACELRGECTIERPLAGVACCSGCGDYGARGA